MGIGVHHLVDKLHKIRVDRNTIFVNVLQLAMPHLLPFGAVHRQRLTTANFVQRSTERKDVGLGKVRMISRQEFQRHVPRISFFHVFMRRAFADETKITKLELIIFDKDIFGFDIQMDHVMTMQKGQSQAHFPQKFVATGEIESILQHFFGEISLAKFGLNEKTIVLHPGLVIPDNVERCRIRLIREGRESIHLDNNNKEMTCVSKRHSRSTFAPMRHTYFFQHAITVCRALGLPLRSLDGVHAL